MILPNTAYFQKINLPDSDISFYPEFLTPKSADSYLAYFLKNTSWRKDRITVFGKTYDQPRLTALYANNANAYSYSGITMNPLPFNDGLLEIKQLIESLIKVEFTSCLLNLYRDGNDSNGWHADDEKELGTNPVIASLSLGQTRRFHLKHKKDKNLKTSIDLIHGSLLVMEGPTQHHWLHQIPKSKKQLGPRINLTFRIIK